MKLDYKQWLAPRSKLAKDRGVKLSSKNLKRLNSIYINWFLETFGFNLNNMFYAVYADKISELIPTESIFMKEVARAGEGWNAPVVLGAEHGVEFGDDDI